MILLAIDTALENCSAGLFRDGELVLREETIGRGHAERLMPAVASLLAEARLAVRDIDRFAATVGPGSFTGLRVGIAAARGLALVSGRPLVGISTLRAHAYLAAALRERLNGSRRPILALLPARGDEIYAELFNADGEPLEPAALASAAALRERVLRDGFDVAGAGAVALGDGLAPLHLLSAPALSSVIALGLALDPVAYPPRPLYVKPPDAQPQARARIARR